MKSYYGWNWHDRHFLQNFSRNFVVEEKHNLVKWCIINIDIGHSSQGQYGTFTFYLQFMIETK